MILFWSILAALTFLAISFAVWPISPRGTINNVLIAIFITVTAFTLYHHWGRSADLVLAKNKQKNAADVQATLKKLGTRENIIVALRQKLLALPQTPEQAKGWYILGKLYFNEKQYPNALDAFSRAVTLKPDEQEYVVLLVSSKFYIYHKLNEQDKNMLRKLAEVKPHNINAINLLALAAYQEGHYSEAVHYWESLLNDFPAESADAQMLLAMIKQGQQRMQANDPHAMHLQVTVNVSSAFKDKIQPNDVLFVYALPDSGPKMPLAVVKVSPVHLPVKLTLSDADSMIAGRNLQSAQKFYIEARISRTGNPIAAEGDYVGKSAVFEHASVPAKVIIQIMEKYQAGT